MIKRVPARRRPLLAPVGCAVLLGAGLAACASSPERRQVALQEDASTCAAFGGRFGSPEYNTCMLAQQRRRDIERIESLERTRLTTEIARNAQLMAERARRERCQRDPERRECGP